MLDKIENDLEFDEARILKLNKEKYDHTEVWKMLKDGIKNI